MAKKAKLSLVARILIAMAVGIAAGFVLPECGIRVLKTFEELVTTLLKFMVILFKKANYPHRNIF